VIWTGLAAVFAMSWTAPDAAMLSREYLFKPNVELTVDADAQDTDAAFRLRTVEFVYPDEDRLVQFSDTVRAEVAVANLGDTSVKVGVAIALFDANGTLVGVASGGSKWLPIKPQRRSYYTLKFTDVDSRIREATQFQITVESK
jgi:hypothetical protein